MPTFIYYINKSNVDSLRGANPHELEAKVKRWIESSSISSGAPAEVPGQVTDRINNNKKETTVRFFNISI